jgi:hypothetical protein
VPGLLPMDREAGHSPPSTAEVTDDRRIPPQCLIESLTEVKLKSHEGFQLTFCACTSREPLGLVRPVAVKAPSPDIETLLTSWL